jgi:hypothetical protein
MQLRHHCQFPPYPFVKLAQRQYKAFVQSLQGRLLSPVLFLKKSKIKERTFIPSTTCAQTGCASYRKHPNITERNLAETTFLIPLAINF